MRGFFNAARVAGVGAGEAEAEEATTGAGLAAASFSASDSLDESSDDDSDDDRFRFFLLGLSSPSGTGLADADNPPLCSLSLFSLARRLPNSPPPEPPSVTPFCGVDDPLPAVTNPLPAVVLFAPDATPIAFNDPTTAAALPRFIPIPSVSSLAIGIAAILREKPDPPFARMADWEEAFPS